MPGIAASRQTDEWLQQEIACPLCARHIAFLLLPVEPSGSNPSLTSQLTQASATVWLRNMHCATCGGSPVISPGEHMYALKAAEGAGQRIERAPSKPRRWQMGGNHLWTPARGKRTSPHIGATAG